MSSQYETFQIFAAPIKDTRLLNNEKETENLIVKDLSTLSALQPFY